MVPSPTVTTSSNWQPPHVPLNISTGLHLHHEAICHPVRNAWGCTEMQSQARGQTVLHPSSPMSSCLHLCCSDREGASAHRLQSPFQTTRTSPNSTYTTHSHIQGGPSLLGISSAFSGFPVICQAPQVVYHDPIATISNSQPLSSTVYSHLSFGVQANSDAKHSQTKPQTPIHSSLTPTGQPQYHTAFSSLTPSRVNTSLCTGQNQGQQGVLSGPRQSDPVGSSPSHQTQDLTNRDVKASLQ